MDQKVYKKWMQKTHLKLQNTGEMEDSKIIERAKTSNESRRMMKSFRKGHKDLNKGEDARSNNQLVKMKKKKLLEKMKKSGKKERGGNNPSNGKYGDK